MSTRCCCPTESAPTRAAAYAVMPTWASTSPTRRRSAARTRRSRPMVATSPLATTSPTVTGSEGSKVAFCGT